MKLDNHSGSINVMKGLLIESKVDNNEAWAFMTVLVPVVMRE